MGRLIPAFIKIGAPDLAGNRPQRTKIAFKDLKGNEIFNAPFRVLLDFGIHNLWQGMINDDLAPKFPRHGIVVRFDGRVRPRAIIEQQRAAAVDFKIEITLTGLGLHKKFNATVRADAGLILGLHTADIFVENPEKHK